MTGSARYCARTNSTPDNGSRSSRLLITWGLRTTATIMFGHVDGYGDWHDTCCRCANCRSARVVFTEFVPLPFVRQ